MEEVKCTVFGKNLKAFRTAKGLTQPQIAEVADVSVTSENKWERQGVQPRRRNIDLILNYFGLSEDDLLSETNGFYAKMHGLTNAPAGAIHVNSSSAKMVPIKVLGSCHAGELDEPWELDGETMLVESMAARHPRCFALEVNGSCMDRVFTSNDYIFVDPDMEPRDGSIAVMLIDGMTEARRLRKGNDTVTLVSESHDPQPDIVIREGDGQELVCQGVVFWWQSKKEVD